MENNMLKDNIFLWVSLIPAITITYFSCIIINEKYEEVRTLKEKIWELEDGCETSYSNRISYTVTVTTYNPTRHQTDSTPNELADGTKIKPWKATQYRYVALSRDLLSRWGGPFDYGDYVVIEGTGKYDGIYQVRDTMNRKWINRVDILTTNGRFKYDNITLYKYVDEYIAENN